jgi:hypothetical protein
MHAISRGAVATSYVYGLMSAAIMGHFLLGVPIQITDSFRNILSLQQGWDVFLSQGLSNEGFLRPMLWVEQKLVFDLSQGSLTPWYRGVHVAQLLAAVLLMLGVLRPRSWRDATTVPLAVAAFLGLHTFKGMVVEAFPVNTFLTIVLCCLTAANLAFMSRPRWWTDLAGIVLFIVAALTVESGLLVWVVFVGGALVGARGMSRRALTVLTALLAGYFMVRFAVLQTGAPGLMERSSGFGLAVLDPPELEARFGANPFPFYLYNVATSFVSVLFGEPRAGVFRLVRAVLTDAVKPAQVVAVVATTMGTALMATYLWQRRRALWRRQFEHADRVVVLFVMVVTANAVISFPYTKDIIMSVAGAFYAPALAVAVGHTILPWAAERGALRAAAATVLCVILATSWAVLQVNAHVNLRVAAVKERNDWAYEPSRMARGGIVLRPDEQRIFDQLKEDAIRPPLPPILWLQDLGIFDVD